MLATGAFMPFEAAFPSGEQPPKVDQRFGQTLFAEKWKRLPIIGAISLIATRLRFAQLAFWCETSAHERLPLGQCSRAAKLVGLSIDEMAFLVKMVVAVGMD